MSVSPRLMPQAAAPPRTRRGFPREKVIGAVLVALVALPLTACASGGSQSVAPPSGSPSPTGHPTKASSGGGNGSTECFTAACKPATLDTGKFVARHDPVVAEYQHALNAFGPYCTDIDSRLGDFAVTSQELLGNGGKDESLLDILQHVRSAIPPHTPKMVSCSDLFATYVILRGGKA